VSPVRYELGFHIPEDGILHSHRPKNSNLTQIWSIRSIHRRAEVVHSGDVTGVVLEPQSYLGIETGRRWGHRNFIVRKGTIFLFWSKELIVRHLQWGPWGLSQDLRRPDREAGHLPMPSIEVDNDWSYNLCKIFCSTSCLRDMVLNYVFFFSLSLY
jgi:hypothetical protein